MVQGASLTCLAASVNGGVYGLIIPQWRRHSNLLRKTHAVSGFDSQCPLHHCLQGLHFMGNPNTLKQRNLRVEAGWLFNKGGEQELDASSERSESANEDILIFFFQLDLATRVQYALNVEQYDIAQQLRNKLTEVEGEVIRQQEAKRGSSSKSEAQDKAISIIRLRSDLQNAIENENYAVAAGLRDQISELEAESLAASAKALVYENAQYAFRLGQKVKHKTFGYQAVVCGMDPICCESSSWMETAQVEKLARGSSQPFYQLFRFWLMYMRIPIYWWHMFPRKIWLLLRNQMWEGLIIPIHHFYSMGWMQQGILSQSNSCVKSTIGLGMKCQWIHQMTIAVVVLMLKQERAAFWSA
ncbi:clp protease adapter protein ClpF, chloroplastic isoform X1 [Populus nigra]|uniref:clp protease adapter protein ClpF, chloroplastic isoform X1 n=1 Tax=Populus nigra TaxID=3691 RepID=UPI002B2786C2|nr:clp protease adapter protein ClpF, chloroplastic isoform X1 [Populus nigra]